MMAGQHESKLKLVLCAMLGATFGVNLREIECDLYVCSQVCFMDPVDHLIPLDISVDCDHYENVSVIPPSQAGNDSFYKLHISNSCMSRLPVNLCDYPIVSLRIVNSSLSSLPSLSCLTYLYDLDLSYNKIRRLDDGVFSGLGQLRSVDLKHNFISSIGYSVFAQNLTGILFLHLEGNQLSTFEAAWPMGIHHPYCIFNVSHNKITQFSNEAGWRINTSQTYGPAWLDLTNNLFSTWVSGQLEAYGFGTLQLLGHLLAWVFDLRHNPWTCDCHFYECLRTSDNFPAIRRKDFFNLYCSNPPHLKGVRILDLPLNSFVCNITEDCPTDCLCQKQPSKGIVFIDCRENGLTELPSSLPSGNIELVLSGNFIQILEYRPYLNRILFFDISKNELAFIAPEALDKMKPEKVLFDISYNKLKYLPIRIRDFIQVRIANNPLVCDCNSTWMIDWIELKFHKGNISSVQCILSDSGESVSVVKADDSYLQCPQIIAIVLSCIFGSLIVIIVIIFSLCCFFRYEIQLIRNSRFQRQEGPNGFSNDVYICINEEEETDRQWVIRYLLPVLEERHHLKVFFPPRDMIPGTVTTDEFIKQMKRSRTVVVVLSQSYLQNPKKCSEFSTIYNVIVKPNTGNVVIIRFPSVKGTRLRELKAFMRLKRYIDVESKTFSIKIMKAINGNDINRNTNNINLVTTRM